MPLKRKGQGSSIQSSQARESLPNMKFMKNLDAANGGIIPSAKNTNSKDRRNIEKSDSMPGAAGKTANL